MTTGRRGDRATGRFAGSPVRRFGFFGGTFNPIHIGHIKMAEAARKEYKLDIVYFIPCGVPPHKPKKGLLPAKLRYELVKKVIKRKKYFKVLDIEIRKKSPAYTIDTVKKILSSTRRYSDTPTLRYFFLIGQDEFEKLHTWTKPSELAKLVTFLVLPRGKKRKVRLPKVKNLKWKLVHTKPINVSSSKIRMSKN